MAGANLLMWRCMMWMRSLAVQAGCSGPVRMRMVVAQQGSSGPSLGMDTNCQTGLVHSRLCPYNGAGWELAAEEHERSAGGSVSAPHSQDTSSQWVM